MLGCDGKIKWKRQFEHLVIEMPSEKTGKYAHPFKIKLDGVAIGGLTVKPQDSTIKAEVKVINYSTEMFSKDLSLYVNEKPVKTQKVTAEPGAVNVVSFSHTVKEPDFYNVAVRHTSFTTPAKKVALPVIDLAGEWLFTKGDSSDYKKIDFDDSSWQHVTLPTIGCAYTQEIDFHWLRSKVFIPKAFEGCGLLLTLGKIDGASETYFNGKRIGRMSRIPFGNERPLYEGTRRDRVRPGLIKYGQENVIAVKIYGLKDCGMYADMQPIEYIMNWKEDDT